jgi:hypothetical protein
MADLSNFFDSFLNSFFVPWACVARCPRENSKVKKYFEVLGNKNYPIKVRVLVDKTNTATFHVYTHHNENCRHVSTLVSLQILI